ncbi:MAG: TonB family protein [Polyangiaceae bacterium]
MALFACVSLSALSARAEVTPPKLTQDPGVHYPEQALARGDTARVVVELVLEIDADGNVSQATLSAPRGDLFDEAALAAARGLRFEPALKDGTPSAAKIRFRYTFEPPPASLSGSVLDDVSGAPIAIVSVKLRLPDGSERPLALAVDGAFSLGELPRGDAELMVEAPGYLPQRAAIKLTPRSDFSVRVRLEKPAAPTPTSPDTKDAPVEVVVRGERLAPAVSSFTRAEVRQLPGAFGDPFRAIEAMPGVTPIVSGLPFFYVRGAPPGNVGYFLDGVRVPFLYHVAIGPSVIHPGLVDRVDLYPGGYPASLGRYAGGVVSAETTAPRASLHGEANIRTFDAGALVEGGFAGGRGTALLAGRYSFTAAMLSLLVPDLKLDYRDYQARISYDVTNRDRLTLLSLGSYDLLAQEQRRGYNVLFGAEFYRVELRHEHQFDHGTLTNSVTLGFDQSHSADEGNAIDRSLTARTRYQHDFSSRTRLRVGADVTLDGYTTARPKYADPDNPETVLLETTNPARTDLATGVWSDWVLKPAPGIEVTPGLRLDMFRSRGDSAVAVDPRISARFRVAPWLTIVHADGIAHQPPSYVIPVPGRALPSLSGGLQQSFQTSAGVEAQLGWDVKATASVFYNAFFNMSDALATRNSATNQDGPPGSNTDKRTLGNAYGFELFLHRSLSKRLGGFLSYTLSRSMRNFEGQRFPSSFDRTHVVNAALAYESRSRLARWLARRLLHRHAHSVRYHFGAQRKSCAQRPLLSPRCAPRKALAAEPARLDLLRGRNDERHPQQRDLWRRKDRPYIHPQHRRGSRILTMNTSILRLVAATSVLICNGSCMPADTRDTPGTLITSVTASDLSQGFVTSDGWAVSITRYLAVVGDVELSGDDCDVYSDSHYSRVLDLLAPSPQRLSQLWGLGECTFEFRISSARWNTIAGVNVSDTVVAELREPPASSIVLEGSAHNETEEKQFAVSFPMDMNYGGCPLPDPNLLPLTLSADQTVERELVLNPSGPFQEGDDPALLTFEPFRAADDDYGNADGLITFEELLAAPELIRSRIPRIGRSPGSGLCSGPPREGGRN